jgi:YHS domain-containing protein
MAPNTLAAFITRQVNETVMNPFRWTGAFVLMLMIAGCNQSIAPEAAATALKRVPTEKVCMVNDEYMSKDQIPVPVGDKVYYGCCQACYGTLQSDESSRYAIDPVSGNRVDKALAIIGAFPDGKVLYFENTQTFELYNTPKNKG